MTEQLQGAIIALGSGLVSVFLAWFASQGWRSLHRPNVRIEAGQGEGFISETPMGSQIRETPEGGSYTPAGMGSYVRARVTNVSRRFFTPYTAKVCVGYLASVSRWDDSKADFVATRYADFLRLGWSHNPGTRDMDLLHDTPHWLDVCFTLDVAKGFFLATQWQANRYMDGFKEAGIYRFTIHLCGENIGPEPVNVYLSWMGDWKKLEVMDEAGWQERKSKLLST